MYGKSLLSRLDAFLKVASNTLLTSYSLFLVQILINEIV
jgi:hypothetical protein